MKADLPPEEARRILSMGFSAADHSRMNALSQKARDGALTPDEQAELDDYTRAGHLLALLHSRARASLSNGSDGDRAGGA